jgi:hypothetical protein
VSLDREALREIRGARQPPGERQRRWFSAPAADLFIWTLDDATVSAFEFCYGQPNDEHALRWDAEAGFTHTRIDDGEGAAHEHRTPIAVPDGAFDPATVALEFERLAAGLEPALYRFILVRLWGLP